MRVMIMKNAKMTLPVSAIKRGPRKARRRWPKRDQHADESDDHRGPTPPTDMLAEQDHGQRRHVDRPGEIEGHHINERKIGDRPVEQSDLDGREQRAQRLQAGPLQVRIGADPLAPDERSEQQQRRHAADQQKLAHRIGGDQPLAHGVVDREQEHAGQHQSDAGEHGGPGRPGLRKHEWKVPQRLETAVTVGIATARRKRAIAAAAASRYGVAR
jgi:hypothetical protein